ncbi:MAG: response regulator transcription factor [Bacteroidetes bacterium]|nr:response regulator transcription factor [Bacteroidota bacterium]MBU1117019.1 response regulator transcription factor [Bacteroidota bacterium]MBU1799713.1 response regulator transcription factor [Bacteroidota bacterium]
MISVAIIEDIKDIRNSLKEFISMQSDMFCAVASESVEEFLEANLQDTGVDVLLLDIDLPGISGISGMKFIKEKYPEIDIIMVTVYEDHDKIFRALKAGAAGYLLKTTPFPKLREAILDINSGGAPMEPIIARKVIEYFNSESKSNNEKSALTSKESQIVNYLVDGFTYKKIAITLDNSIETIRHHVKNIYKKLQINSRTELIKKKLN